MKQGIKKIENLNDLLISCEGLSLEEIEQKGRAIFSDLFLSDTRRGCCQTHDGQKVVFFNDTFDHAFYVSPEKSVLDVERVKRIHWIPRLIRGEVPCSECWEIQDGAIYKRVYVCFSVGYIVWLKERLNGGWKFITAYPAYRGQIRKYIKGGERIAAFK